MSKADAIEVFHYAGCSTCKKALKWLTTNGLRFEAIPIVERPPSARSLASWAKKSGLPVRKLVNVSGESYRALIATRGKEAVAALDDAALLALLAADGKMIKRPLLVRGDLVLVGFDEAAYERALKA
jgi:arsenate reductase